jgi:heterotetrameric sarcosine oxidase gamma subunit
MPPEGTLALRSPFAGIATGRRGAAEGPPGVRLTLLADRRRLVVEALPGRLAEAAAALAHALGFGAPTTPGSAAGRGITVLAIGPGRWQIVFEAGAAPPALASGLAGIATVTDASHLYAALQLEGPRAVEILRRLVTLDVDPAVFPPGAVATTEVHTMTVQLRRAGEAYELAAGRSYAASLVEEVVRAAAAFGVMVVAEG